MDTCRGVGVLNCPWESPQYEQSTSRYKIMLSHRAGGRAAGLLPGEHESGVAFTRRRKREHGEGAWERCYEWDLTHGKKAIKQTSRRHGGSR